MGKKVFRVVLKHWIMYTFGKMFMRQGLVFMRQGTRCEKVPLTPRHFASEVPLGVVSKEFSKIFENLYHFLDFLIFSMIFSIFYGICKIFLRF